MTAPNVRSVIVLDTNVVVSALLKADGPPALLLGAILRGQVQIAFDARILTEYRDVLLRPKFGFDPTRVSIELEDLAHEGIAVAAPPLDIHLPDHDDLKFLEVASALNPPVVLITGNMRHFPSELCGQVRVMAPREWLERLYS